MLQLTSSGRRDAGGHPRLHRAGDGTGDKPRDDVDEVRRIPQPGQPLHQGSHDQSDGPGINGDSVISTDQHCHARTDDPERDDLNHQRVAIRQRLNFLQLFPGLLNGDSFVLNGLLQSEQFGVAAEIRVTRINAKQPRSVCFILECYEQRRRCGEDGRRPPQRRCDLFHAIVQFIRWRSAGES